MLFRDIPIQKKLMRIIFVISILVLLFTCFAFFFYEYYSFKKTSVEKIITIGKIISSNSTAAIAFENAADADEILSALRSEPTVISAALYDADGAIFSEFHAPGSAMEIPRKPGEKGYSFSRYFIEGFQPVTLNDKVIGHLYLKTDLREIYDRIKLYLLLIGVVAAITFFMAYLTSKVMKRSIANPILNLAEAARKISMEGDYSFRVSSITGKDEIGQLSEAFNRMIGQIDAQNKELTEFNKSLEIKVQERTKELEQANKELEAFSYSVSHDLRAPIRGINGYSSILKKEYKDRLNEEGLECLDIIISEASRMGHLIDGLLDFSHLGNKQVKKEPVNMNELVREVLAEIQKHHGRPLPEGILIKELPDSHCDKTLIRQVWVNLISNSLKYSGKKPDPQIEIGSFQEGELVTYYVKDNGVGFDMKYYSKLFGVFQRLHSSEEFTGTGIGLAIVHRVVTKHGGKVRAEGKVNEGATVYFSLPDCQPS